MMDDHQPLWIDKLKYFDIWIPSLHVEEFQSIMLPLMERALRRSPESMMVPLLQFARYASVSLLNMVIQSCLKLVLHNIKNSDDTTSKRSSECLCLLWCRCSQDDQMKLIGTELFELYHGKEILIEHKHRILNIIMDAIESFSSKMELCRFLLGHVMKIIDKESNERIVQTAMMIVARLVAVLDQLDNTASISQHVEASLKNTKHTVHQRAVLIAFPFICRSKIIDCTRIGLSSLLNLFNKLIATPILESDFIYVCRSLLALQETDLTAGKLYGEDKRIQLNCSQYFECSMKRIKYEKQLSGIVCWTNLRFFSLKVWLSLMKLWLKIL
jgi:hypothetical protein